MKRDFDAAIRDLNKEAVRAGATLEVAMAAINAAWPVMSSKARTVFNGALQKATGAPPTLRMVCISALMAAYPDEPNLSADEAIKRMALARRVHRGGVIEIAPEERDLMKQLIRKRYGGVLIPVVAGELLEAEPQQQAA